MDTGELQNKINELNNFFGNKAILLGTPLHTNIGDRAIAYAERVFLRDNNFSFVEIPFGAEIEDLEVSPDVVIFLHGGGNFGDIWFEEEIFRRKAISKFKGNKIILMPQTIFFEDIEKLRDSIEIYSKHPNLTLVAREKVSYRIMSRNFIKNNIEFAPDIVLNLDIDFNNNREGVIFSIRDDVEKIYSDDDISKLEEVCREKVKGSLFKYSDMRTNEGSAISASHEDITIKKLDEFSRSELVVTDRLHAMIFCAITRTPCIALGSKTYKTKGVYDAWLKDLRYIEFCENIDEAILKIKTMDINMKKNKLCNKKNFNTILKKHNNVDLKPLVSVIVPVYNVEKYIEECLKSVLNQTYKNIEIIVVDDGSPDKSHEIAQKIANSDTRVKVISQKNRGLNGARETGFKNSTGDFITFVDSDDMIHPQFIEKMMIPLLNKKAEFSICQYDNFKDNPEFVEVAPGIFPVSKKKITKRFLTEDQCVPYIFYQTAWGKMFPRRMIERINWKFSNYKINEDEFFSTMIYSILRGKVAMVLSPMYFYRQNPDSIMSSINKEYNNFFEGKKITRIEALRRFNEKRLELFPEFKFEILRHFWHHLINSSNTLIGGRGSKADIRNFVEIFEKYKDGFEASFEKYGVDPRSKRIFDLLKLRGGKNISRIYDDLPKVSVVIPIYNAEKYLEETLDSVKSQTFSNFEVILVDDGSKDRSGEICDRFVKEDPRFKVFHKENGGVSRARNFGIDQSSGEYITFVDADDILTPLYLEQMTVETYSGADVISSQIIIKNGDNLYNNDGRYLGIPFDREINYKTVDFKEMCSFMDGLNYPIAKLIKTDFIRENNLKFPEGIRFGEDLVFVVKSLFSADKIKAIEDWVYIYRRDDDNDHSATNSIANKKFDFALALRAIYDFLKESGLYEYKMVADSFKRGVVMHSFYSLSISRGDFVLNKEIFDFIKNKVFVEYGIDKNVIGLPAEQQAYFIKLLENEYQDYAIWLMSGGYYLEELRRCQEVINAQSFRIEILQSGRGALRNMAGSVKRKLNKEIEIWKNLRSR